MNSIKQPIYTLIIIIGLLYTSCNKEEIPELEPKTFEEHVINIELESSDETIVDIDIQGKFLYFSTTDHIYKLDITDSSDVPKLMTKVEHTAIALTAVDNRLFYIPFWFYQLRFINFNTPNNELIDNNIKGVIGYSLTSYKDELFYVSSKSTLDHKVSFYRRKIEKDSPSKLITTAEYIIPKNLVVQENYLYFTNERDILRINLSESLSNPKLLYTVSRSKNSSIDDIDGLAMHNNYMYFSQQWNKNLYRINLNDDVLTPEIILSDDDCCMNGYANGYEKLMVRENKLYMKQTNRNSLLVLTLK